MHLILYTYIIIFFFIFPLHFSQDVIDFFKNIFVLILLLVKFILNHKTVVTNFLSKKGALVVTG